MRAHRFAWILLLPLLGAGGCGQQLVEFGSGGGDFALPVLDLQGIDFTLLEAGANDAASDAGMLTDAADAGAPDQSVGDQGLPDQSGSELGMSSADAATDLRPADLASMPDLPDHCMNGVRDGDESDTDCGGSCSKCGFGKNCFSNSDCQSNVCTLVSKVCG